jgi:hypothetical protein
LKHAYLCANVGLLLSFFLMNMIFYDVLVIRRRCVSFQLKEGHYMTTNFASHFCYVYKIRNWKVYLTKRLQDWITISIIGQWFYSLISTLYTCVYSQFIDRNTFLTFILLICMVFFYYFPFLTIPNLMGSFIFFHISKYCNLHFFF